MNLIHIVPGINEEASGPSYSVVRLCESLMTQGQNTTLATLDWAPMDSPPLFLKTFPLGIGPYRLGRSSAMRNWLASTAKSGAVDLMHSHGLWMMPNVYPGQVNRRSNVPLIVSPRGTLSKWAFTSGSILKKVFWSLLQKKSLQAAICFHATAYSEYEDIRRMGFRQPVAVIPNGVDIPPPKQVSNSETRTLLFLGRIHPVKGIDMLLKAWGIVSPRFPEWQLHIVGPDSGGYLARMQTLAANRGLVRIAFSGPLYGDAKWQAYQEADLFVLPTHTENFGMAVAEALAAGTPAIVSKGAPWQGLQAASAGWWIDVGVDPLVACLEGALANSHETLHAMGQRGQDWMLRDFSWTEIAHKASETYRWILNAGNKPDWVRRE